MDSSSSGLPYEVYLGPWINWSRGRVLGATLTLDKNNGNLLIAFVAFFVAIVATRFWRIACLILHFAFSTNQAQDGIHHQRQAILRNIASPDEGAMLLLNVAWAWRGKARGALFRLVPLMLFAASCAVLFTLAGGYSSRLSTNGSEVLLSGKKCGQLYDDGNHTAADVQNQLYPARSKADALAATYAQQCYTENSTSVFGCGTFPKRKLPMIINKSAPCPFAEGMCKTNTSNLIIDTGLLNSHGDLGLNAPPTERIQARKLLHCAPLVTEGYKDTYNDTSNQAFDRYYYGPEIYFNITQLPNGTSQNEMHTINYTYQYAHLPPFPLIMKDTPSFTLTPRVAFYYNGSFDPIGSAFQPIQALERTDADVALAFLSSNLIRYTAQTDDLWYHTTTPAGTIKNMDTPGGRLPVYAQDELAAPLGCIEQVQFCDPNKAKPGSDDHCTPLAGYSDAYDLATALFADEASSNRFNWLYSTAFGDPWLSGVLLYLGPELLTARYGIKQGISAAVPANQWQLEVEHWMGTILAGIQDAFVGVATGPSDPSLANWYRGANNTQEAVLCASQKILSEGYISFNIFGVCFILLLGGAIILTSYLLGPILASTTRRWGPESFAQMEWSTNQTLQLQRLVHEELGMGTWSNTTSLVPVTRPGESLGLLDLSRSKHPRFQNPLDSDGASFRTNTLFEKDVEKSFVRIVSKD